MLEQPLFSIAIPTYNRIELLKKAVKSALDQTYQTIEIVIFDNASTDGTKEWIDDLAFRNEKIKVIHQPNNLGFVGNVKTIPNYIKGKYLVVLSDDDLLEPDFVKEAVHDMESCPEATVWYCRTLIIDQKNNLSRLSISAPNVEFGYEFIRNWLLIKRESYWCATVYKTKALQEIGGFNGNTMTIDASSRALCALMGKVVFNCKYLASYLSHTNNTINTCAYNEHFSAYKEVHELIKKALEKSTNCYNKNILSQKDFELMRKFEKQKRYLFAYHMFRFWEGHIRCCEIKESLIFFIKMFSIYPFYFSLFLLKRFPIVVIRFLPSRLYKKIWCFYWGREKFE